MWCIGAGGRAYGRVRVHMAGPDGAGGVLLLIRTHLTRRCPLFYCAPGRQRRAAVCFFPIVLADDAFNPPPLVFSSLGGNWAGGVLAVGRRGHEYSK